MAEEATIEDYSEKITYLVLSYMLLLKNKPQSDYDCSETLKFGLIKKHYRYQQNERIITHMSKYERMNRNISMNVWSIANICKNRSCITNISNNRRKFTISVKNETSSITNVRKINEALHIWAKMKEAMDISAKMNKALQISAKQ